MTMIRTAAQVCQKLMIAVAVMAVVLLGFAHRSGKQTLSPELADYVAAGGAISDICGLTGGDGMAVPVDCEACRIGDAAHLVGVCYASPPRLAAQTFVLRSIGKRIAHSRALDPARLVRAPPRA
ncbi:hypothetical protein [Sulfitobacter sp. S190]|uniref:hypothetical protein n=1 Tax=Sulfitobacter sp. S190 TaxID=2867022 RepID=UPI0021A3AC25|nr:hypothetical protein [Sulfitobacter sp. S190]UWR24515.1 hypothetical protein K3756_18870 [Sulfitobacter sp. S190]